MGLEGIEYNQGAFFRAEITHPFLHCSLFLIPSYTSEIPSISQHRYTVEVQ